MTTKEMMDTFTKVNKGTQKAAWIIWDLEHNTDKRDIHDAYGRPSVYKVRSFEAIRDRALNTPGYNGDLHISGAGSSFYSTVYSVTADGQTWIIKDTYANTYITEA